MSHSRIRGTLPFGDARADDVGAVRGLLRVDGDEVVDRRVGGDDHGAGRDGVAVGGDDARVLGVNRLDLVGVRLREDLPAESLDRAREPLEILEDVELPLPREAQGAARVERLDGRAFDQLDVGQAGAVRGRQLVVEFLLRFASGAKR